MSMAKPRLRMNKKGELFNYLSPTRWSNLIKEKPFCVFTTYVNNIKVWTFNVYFRHVRFDEPEVVIRPSKGQQRRYYGPVRGYTKALILIADSYQDYYFYGKAECSWSDNFSRPEGRKQALARALSCGILPVLPQKQFNEIITTMSLRGGGIYQINEIPNTL